MKTRLFLVFFLYTLTSAVHAQQTGFANIAKAGIDSFTNKFPQEKIYIHTDRAAYRPEETIWFKLYAMTDGLPSYVSKVAYTDLVNAAGNVVDKKMLSLNGGTAYNNIDLPANIPEGKYLLRGYTLWMLNFPDFLFTKEINIVGNKQQPAQTYNNQLEVNLRFFPEGGDLIEGIATHIAFKATFKNETPANISGTIITGEDKEIAVFKTIHDGMGSILLTPVPGVKYFASYTVNNKTYKTLLPPSKPEGISLQVDNSGTSKVFLKVERSENNKAQFNKFYIIGQQLGRVVYTANVNFEEGQTAAMINKKNLLPGILQLTLFNADQQPLSERLVFIAPLEQDAVSFKTDTVNLMPRAKNTFSLENMNISVNTSLSISITDAGLLPDAAQDNILTSMLLSSDLHGKINNPFWYFKNKDSATINALDLLMLTNGWRRFTWNDILNKKDPPLSFIAEPGNVLAGKVVKAGNKNVAITDGRMEIITKAEDSTIILNTIQLSKDGDFFIPDLSFKKRARLYFKGTNAKKENAYVFTTINPAYIDTFKKVNTSLYKDFFAQPHLHNTTLGNTAGITFIKDSTNSKLLKEVQVRTKRISPEDSVSNLYSTALFNNSDNTLIVDEKTRYFNIWQLIRSSVSGIEITGDLNNPTVFFKRYGNISNVFGSQDNPDEESTNVSTTNGISYYLNEVNVTKDIIDNLSINDVALIKVFKGTSAFILGPGDGAIAIYTKNGDAATDPREKTFETILKTGFSVAREYYSPDYSRETTSIETDTRPSLYWNPNVKFNKSGKAVFSFYSSDISKKIFINIQGFDNDGRLINIQKSVEQ